MAALRIAFSTLACPDWTLAEVLDAAVGLGYQGLELRLLDGKLIDPVVHAADVEQAVQRSRSRKIEVCAFDTSCRLAAADPRERARTLEDLRAWIVLARRCAVPVLRVFGGADPDDGDAADVRLAGAIEQILPVCAGSGVTVALETHDAYSSARRVARVLDRISSSGGGALWDSHHPYRMGESPAQVAEALGPRIVHVHVKDARRVAAGGDWQLVPLGEGEVPVREQLATLLRIGYRGWISVEWEKKWHPELAPPEIALPQHREWLAQTLAGLEGG